MLPSDHTLFEKVSALDDRLSRRLRMDKTQARGWKLVVFLAHSGDSWFWLAGLLLVWIFRVAYYRTAAFLILAIILLAALVMVIKLVVRRRRPHGEWGAVYRNTDPHSFPSGHAARAAMLALFAVVLGPFWLALIMVVWALLVGLSRVMTGMHYLSDVVAGMLLGVASGGLILLARPWLEALLPFLF